MSKKIIDLLEQQPEAGEFTKLIKKQIHFVRKKDLLPNMYRIMDTALEACELLDRLEEENKRLRGEEPIPFAWWKDCPGLAQKVMESRGTFCNLTTPNIVDSAAGVIEYSNSIIDQVNEHLNGMIHAFYGVSASSMNEFVPLYQAVLLLEDAGINVFDSERGCLTSWYIAKRKESLDVKKQYGKDLFLSLLRVNRQLIFWQEEWEKITSTAGLIKRDPKRQFSLLDRLEAWERQGGKCAVCSKAMTLGKAVGHHIVPHSQGGPTEHHNCALVHEKCHREAISPGLPGLHSEKS